MAAGKREFALMSGGETAPVVPPAQLPPAPDEGGSLAYLLNAAWEGRRFIVGALATSALGLIAYLAIAVPVYESDVLLQIEQRRQGGGQALSDLPTLLAGPQSQADIEIEILQSRMLLGSVVDDLNLDISASPVYFPVIGRAWARHHKAPAVAAAPWGLSRFAWGGEAITVPRLDVPEELGDETVSLLLVAGTDGTFEIRSKGGKAMAVGHVGQAVNWDMATPGGQKTVTLFVQDLLARPGTEFKVSKVPRLEVIDRLGQSLRLVEKGRKTGVIRMSMEGPNPRLLVATLDTLAQAYLRHNVERRSDEAQQTLSFLDSQIPTLRGELLASEAALEKHRKRAGGGGVDLSASTKATLDRTVDMEKRLSEMKLQRKELLMRFTETHPAVQVVERKITQLQEERATLNEQIRQLPEAESVSLRLMRDVKVANELYVTLLNKAQELKVMKSGLVGNAHVLDLAVRRMIPVSPDRTRSTAIAIVAGLFVGLALALVRKVLHQGLVDPAEAERATGVPVRASVPHSDRQMTLLREGRGGRERGPFVLAAVDPSDMASEALRSLRTSLQFALMEAPNHVVAIGSPRPAVGKSFITVNLGQVFADAGKRVLVLDADLRKGSLHDYLGVERAPGLAEAIAGMVPAGDVLRKTVLPGVDFIPRGSAPSNPSELLGSERFRKMIEELSSGYDVVLVDLPPILAVTDAALVGRVAGVNLLVIRAGWHPVRELQLAVKAYAENGVHLSGMVFNDIPQGKGSPGGYAYRYSYQYSYKPREGS